MNKRRFFASLLLCSASEEYIFSFFADLLLGPLADGGEPETLTVWAQPCACFSAFSFFSFVFKWTQTKTTEIHGDSNEKTKSKVLWFSIARGLMLSMSQPGVFWQFQHTFIFQSFQLLHFSGPMTHELFCWPVQIPRKWTAFCHHHSGRSLVRSASRQWQCSTSLRASYSQDFECVAYQDVNICCRLFCSSIWVRIKRHKIVNPARCDLEGQRHRCKCSGETHRPEELWTLQLLLCFYILTWFPLEQYVSILFHRYGQADQQHHDSCLLRALGCSPHRTSFGITQGLSTLLMRIRAEMIL